MGRATHHKITMLNVLGLFSLFLVIPKGHAYQFKVGGSGDWSLASCSSYDQWAHKSRFQIGDTLSKFHAYDTLCYANFNFEK